MTGTRERTTDILLGRATWADVGSRMLLVVATSTVIVWVNQEIVVPPGARAHFMVSMLSMSGSQPIDFLEKADRIGLLLTPLAVAIRIVFVALVAQLGVLLQGRIISLAEAVRAATVAFWGVVFGMTIQSVWLWRKGGDRVRVEDLSVVRDSLAHVLEVDVDASLAVYLLAAHFSVHALVWMLGLGLGLGSAQGVDPPVALRSVAFVWVTVVSGTVSLALLGQALGG